jgi:hypothetical protein
VLLMKATFDPLLLERSKQWGGTSQLEFVTPPNGDGVVLRNRPLIGAVFAKVSEPTTWLVQVSIDLTGGFDPLIDPTLFINIKTQAGVGQVISTITSSFSLAVVAGAYPGIGDTFDQGIIPATSLQINAMADSNGMVFGAGTTSQKYQANVNIWASPIVHGGGPNDKLIDVLDQWASVKNWLLGKAPLR